VTLRDGTSFLMRAPCMIFRDSCLIHVMLTFLAIVRRCRSDQDVSRDRFDVSESHSGQAPNFEAYTTEIEMVEPEASQAPIVSASVQSTIHIHISNVELSNQFLSPSHWKKSTGVKGKLFSLEISQGTFQPSTLRQS
jgi:hypothetical protein